MVQNLLLNYSYSSVPKIAIVHTIAIVQLDHKTMSVSMLVVNVI